MLEAVKKKESERKYTPESEQHRFGNLQCIVDLWRIDAADKVDDCWRSRLLPEGEIVTIGRGGIPWFVVRVYDNTVLLWEGEWKETCFRFKFADDLELVYMPIYDLSDVLVYPTKAVSPLSRRIAGCKIQERNQYPASGCPSPSGRVSHQSSLEQHRRVDPCASLR